MHALSPCKGIIETISNSFKVLSAYCGWEYDLVNVERHDEMKSVEVVIKAMIIGQNLQPSALPSLSVQELRSSFWVIRQMPG